MEQSKVGQEAEVVRQGARDVAMVEVDPSDSADVGVVEGGGAENAGVVADVGAIPIGSEVRWVFSDGMFPSLESGVGLKKSGVREKWRRWRRSLLMGRLEEEGEDRDEEESTWEKGG